MRFREICERIFRCDQVPANCKTVENVFPLSFGLSHLIVSPIKWLKRIHSCNKGVYSRQVFLQQNIFKLELPNPVCKLNVLSIWTSLTWRGGIISLFFTNVTSRSLIVNCVWGFEILFSKIIPSKLNCTRKQDMIIWHKIVCYLSEFMFNTNVKKIVFNTSIKVPKSPPTIAIICLLTTKS